MAFESHKEIGDLSKNHNSSELHPQSQLVPYRANCNSFPIQKSSSHRKSHFKQPLNQNPKVIPSKSILKSKEPEPNSRNTGSATPNATYQSFTDLPSAVICEILKCLDPKELGIVSCVSTQLNNLISDLHGWKKFYFDRWGPHSPPVDPQNEKPSWKEMFVERDFRAKSFMGRFTMDTLHGHTEAVRSVFVLVSAKLIFTGGYDYVVRMWDLEEGFSIGASRSLGCTIRAISADSDLLVAGGTDAFIQCWKAVEGNPHLFDLTSSNSNSNFEFRLWGHEGPITCLGLDSMRIYSGSWDMTVRVWDRSSMECVTKLRHRDWVWALCPRDNTVAVTAGKNLYIWEISTGEPLGLVLNPHKGNAYALARSHTGDLVFSGGEDGTIHMYDLNTRSDLVISSMWAPHTGAVNSLSFEYPWLVSCSTNGRIALIDVRKLVVSRKNNSESRARTVASGAGDIEPPQRMLHGFGCNLFSVDVGWDRIVCAGEEGVVRVWNFSQAIEMERRARALRSVRLENRMRRKKVQMEMMNGGTGGGPHCAAVLKKNALNGERNGVWHSKRGVGGKLKA
ncbi:F-box/WD-40 repeat-containing protein [Rhynchospora pubera]|uniref:F-box/WD-40 repeat-containing protein n=1 Tax=Rhynchospora pubera TaxID=906938 RepID=A0AAV8CHD5_9POAL|nr:F-box/WD-40 repeat-containing protein [Rhynchospora pubera]